jgi:capsular exopolysaccharide synthesis family protein
MNANQSVDVSRALSLIRDRWYIVLLVTLVVAGAAWGYTSKMATPRYEATALVTYEEPSADSNPTGGVLPSRGVTRENIQTLIGQTSNNGVLKSAAASAGMELDEFKKVVRVNPHDDASIIDFVATADTPEDAAKRSNAYAQAFVQDRKQRAGKQIDTLINATDREIKSIGKIRPDDPQTALVVTLRTKLSDLRTQRQQWTESILVSTQATEPTEPVWPRTSLTLLVSLLAGLVLGSGVALLAARVDRKLHGDEFDDLPAPVLVRVPSSDRAPRTSPLSPHTAEPIVADAFAALGSRVMLEHSGESATVVLVTSARSSEGKSSVAANLSSALAQGGRRVVLVDADMRKPSQDVIFPSLQGRPGLSHVLTRSAEVESSLTLVAPNLAAIASGPRQNNASILLASVAFRQLIERLANISDVIVIDAPPVLAVTDALAMAPVATQVLLIARVGASNVAEIEEAHTRLASASSTPQAIALIGTRRPTGYGYDDSLRRATPQRVAYPPPQPPAGSRQSAPTPPASAEGAVAPPSGSSPPPSGGRMSA